MNQLTFKFYSNNEEVINEKVNYFINDNIIKFKINDDLYEYNLNNDTLLKKDKEKVILFNSKEKRLKITIENNMIFNMGVEDYKHENKKNKIIIEYSLNQEEVINNKIIIDY